MRVTTLICNRIVQVFICFVGVTNYYIKRDIFNEIEKEFKLYYQTKPKLYEIILVGNEICFFIKFLFKISRLVFRRIYFLKHISSM